eukprot:TRINITY_DN170_c0_g1_i2.p1 TRINITY_DN170_c0_g1~~TRINITY_DN170_c0_g1_i2.p1  ORF type:complete len:647 (+),score=176.95 TRINITY_DN170_c0_g1_i2:435-2375(+)
MCRSQLLHHAEDSSLSPDGQVLDADTHLTAVPLPVLAAHEWEWSRPVEAASVTCDTPALVPVHASPADSVTASPVASPTAHGVVPQATPLAVLEAHSWEWCTPEGQCGDLTALLTSRSVTDTQQPDLSTDTTCRDRIVQQAADAVTPTLVPAADTVAEEVCAVGVIPASPGVDVGVQCMLCDTHSVGQLADDSLQDFSDAVVESSATRDTLQPFEAATDALRASTSDVADEPVNTSEPQQTPLVVSEWESVRPINASDLATSARETWAHLTSSMSDTEESEETSDVRKPAAASRSAVPVLSDTQTTDDTATQQVLQDVLQHTTSSVSSTHAEDVAGDVLGGVLFPLEWHHEMLPASRAPCTPDLVVQEVLWGRPQNTLSSGRLTNTSFSTDTPHRDTHLRTGRHEDSRASDNTHPGADAPRDITTLAVPPSPMQEASVSGAEASGTLDASPVVGASQLVEVEWQWSRPVEHNPDGTLQSQRTTTAARKTDGVAQEADVESTAGVAAPPTEGVTHADGVETHLTAVPLPVLAAHEWESARPINASDLATSARECSADAIPSQTADAVTMLSTATGISDAHVPTNEAPMAPEVSHPDPATAPVLLEVEWVWSRPAEQPAREAETAQETASAAGDFGVVQQPGASHQRF